MRVSDIVLEVRSLALGRIGQIDIAYLLDSEFIKRFNNVGAWRIVLPSEYKMAKELAQPGRGIILEGPYSTLMSGRVVSWDTAKTAMDPQGALTILGVDDCIHLADGYAWPHRPTQTCLRRLLLTTFDPVSLRT